MPLLYFVLVLLLITAIWAYNGFTAREKSIERAQALLDHALAKRMPQHGDPYVTHAATEAQIAQAIANYDGAVADYEALRAHKICGVAGWLMGKREKLRHGTFPTPIAVAHPLGGHDAQHGHGPTEAVAM